MKEGNVPSSDRLVTARELEALGVMKKGTAWKMVAKKYFRITSSEMPVAEFGSRSMKSWPR